MNFKSNHSVVTPVQHKLEIEVPWEELKERIPKAVAWFTPRVAVKGFRKGKASENVVRSKIGEKEILKRAGEILAGDAYKEAIKEIEQQPIMSPKLDYEDIEEGKPLKFTATYYVQPPDAQTVTKEIQKKYYENIPDTDSVMQSNPVNIQHHGGHPVAPDVLKNIPALNITDNFVPNPLPQTPNPQAQTQSPEIITPDSLDPEKMVQHPDVRSHIPKSEIDMSEEETTIDQPTVEEDEPETGGE